MKKFFVLIITISLFTLSIMYHKEIVSFIIKYIGNTDRVSTKLDNNKYASNNSYTYLKLTDDFEPKNKDDIKNIYYTVIQSGMSEFTFYCSKEYKDCIDDVNYISNDQKLLSHINNFVPVYNSFKNIETEFDNLGKVDIRINHTYKDEEINKINEKITEIKNNNITDDMDNEKKIKVLHDYIINNTKYDKERADNKSTKYHSDTAYGALIEGYAICGGYADSLKLFLDDLNIPNFKISSENHIWNAVYLNDNWYHIDLTWDDPITSTGEDILEYNYFLITTDELLELESEQHQFDKNVYLELKEA